MNNSSTCLTCSHEQSKFKVKKIFLRLKNPYGGFSTNPTSNHITVNIRLCLIAKISRRPSETEKIAHCQNF